MTLGRFPFADCQVAPESRLLAMPKPLALPAHTVAGADGSTATQKNVIPAFPKTSQSTPPFTESSMPIVEAA